MFDSASQVHQIALRPLTKDWIEGREITSKWRAELAHRIKGP